MCCGQKCALSKVTMKLISMAMLLLTDCDVTFTIMGLYTFWQLEETALFVITSVFILTYCGGCFRAWLMQTYFITQWLEKVKDGMVPEFEWDQVRDVKTEDQMYDLCARPGRHVDGSDRSDGPPCLYIYYAERRRFRRQLVLLRHSIPYYRTMSFAWREAIKPVDFAGILNANGLWSFTAGIGMQGCSIYCMEQQGFNAVLFGSLVIGVGTTLMSLANIVFDFPGQLSLLEQRQQEKMTLEIQAERATANDIESMEQIKRDKKSSIMSKERLKQDPVGAVKEYDLEVEEINKAKLELLKLTFRDVEASYKAKKKAYEDKDTDKKNRKDSLPVV